MNDGNFRYLSDFLRRQSGLILDDSNRYLLETRLTPLLKNHNLGNLNALAEAIRGDDRSGLAIDTIHAMTTNETFFFRDKIPFEHVRDTVMPALIAALRSAPGLRFEGVCTLLANAGDPKSPITDAQMRVFHGALATLDSAGMRPPLAHVANSAALVLRAPGCIAMDVYQAGRLGRSAPGPAWRARSRRRQMAPA